MLRLLIMDDSVVFNEYDNYALNSKFHKSNVRSKNEIDCTCVLLRPSFKI